MAKVFEQILNKSIQNILDSALKGEFAVSLPAEDNIFGEGVSVFVGENKLKSSKPVTRNVVSLTPEASVLIKKKAFSSLKSGNDLQWLDRTETMLLRATKALFAYKVSQIRAYESLTKFEDVFKETKEISLELYIDLLHQSQFLTVSGDQDTKANASLIIGAVRSALQQTSYQGRIDDLLKLLQRNVFSKDNKLTTWVVDPSDVDNYQTGPGTGVIDFTSFSSFNTLTGITKDSKDADLQIVDPYRILNISEEDIEVAIEEALYGTVGLFNALSGSADKNYVPPFDAKSVLSAGLELVGLGSLDNTIDINYIRNRLRVFYLGKLIINPGDIIHYYIRGNKFTFEYQNGEVQNLDYVSIDETILEAERFLFTNRKVDFETYKKLRLFSDESFGFRHVFAGLVKSTSESYSSGSWRATVSCKDNMEWLKWSTFMIEPALQDPNGVLEDPLTPYKLNVDDSGRILSGAGPELLDENKELLRSGLLSYDSGILNGQVATESNLLQGQYNNGGSLHGSKIMQHPNGLVYRWKTGVISATAGFSVKDPIREDETSLRLNRQTYGLTVAEDILNNLDIANILSLIIVGQPYNVETFMQQALQASNISAGSSVSSLSSRDPLSSVVDVIRRQNNRFGGFKPYRMITLSNNTLQQSVSGNLIRLDVNNSIKELQVKRAKLTKVLKDLGKSEGVKNNAFLISKISDQIYTIQKEIESQVQTIAGTSGTSVPSDVLNSNYNLFGRNRTLPLTGNFDADHQITRAMTLVGAQRRIEDVRLNRDQNLFIVSDQYDQNTDIRPYIFAMKNSNYKIFQGTYIDVYSKCVEASNYMNMEFFANSQGHLEFRPPEWNKTPLSVLKAMFEMEKMSDKKIIPTFLHDIFETRAVSLKREIHAYNIRIVTLALLLGRFPDGSLIPNFPNFSKIKSGGSTASSSGVKSLQFFGVSVGGLNGSGNSLVTNDAKLNIGKAAALDEKLRGSGLSLNISFGDGGDVLFGDTETILGVFDPIFQESSSSNKEGVSLGQDILTVASSPSGESSNEYSTPDNLNKIREDFRKNFGDDPSSDLLNNQEEFTPSHFIFGLNKESDNITMANSYLSKLEQAVSARDKLVTILLRNKEKQDEIDEIENILSGDAFSTETVGGPLAGAIDAITRVNNVVKTTADIFTGDATKGSIFDHLIEDDDRNLLGPGSAKRFIINEQDVISVQYYEDPPDFVKAEVIGDAPIIGKDLAASFDNKYYWAGATDFDLWRQFGHMSGQQTVLPFANDAERQSRPFAIFLLQLQRVKINRASVTLPGNEYYEPGDVVYIPDKGLLYYVSSVSHSFNYGSTFNTTLSLINGKPPGEYLPSPLDIIGQQLTKDPLYGNLLVYRNINGDDAYRPLQPDSALIFPPNKEVSEDNVAPLLDYKDNQARYYNMMLDLETILIGDRYVLLRGFVKTQNSAEEEDVKKRLKTIRKLLENPVQLSQNDINQYSNVDDVLDSTANVFGSSIGFNKTVIPMQLPNGIQAVPIDPSKIIEQIVYLESKTSDIQCLDSKLLKFQNSISSDENSSGIFPKGGPKQRSWLDTRDDLSRVSNVIEIGILNINKKIEG